METFSMSTPTINNNDILLQKLHAHATQIEGGLEISSYYTARSAGTLSAIVYDKITDKPYILSNNHVLNKKGMFKNSLSRSIPIVQPSVNSSGGAYASNIIAYVSKSVQITSSNKENPVYNVADCAIAELISDIAHDNTVLSIGTVRGSIEPQLGLPVKKVGRTTGFSEGMITTLNVSLGLKDTGAKEATMFYKNFVRCSLESQPGDSGALILDPLNRAVGLLTSGRGKNTTFCPIDTILTLLNVIL